MLLPVYVVCIIFKINLYNKYIYGSFIFTAAIESCLFHGLKKSSANFFKPVSTYSLLQKVGKKCEQAKSVLLMCEEYEKAYCNPRFLNNQNTNSHSTLSR